MQSNPSATSLRAKVSLLGLVFALCACGAQPPRHADTPLPTDSKQAYISTESENNHQIYSNRDRRMYITSLDGKSLKAFLAATPWPQELFIEPGKRTIGVLYTHEEIQSRKLITFVAQEGKRYKVRRKLSGYTIQFWIQDEETKSPVPELAPEK